VHYGGVACDMVRILEIAHEHDLVVIEDNAHGLFAKYQGKYLGTFGALATQSFHETKNLTCGEGGALLINDRSLIERAEILREKGTDRSKFLRGQVDKYTWVDIGSSWIMSDMLAAVLYGQLERCDEILSQRMAIWNRYASEFTEWAAKNGVRIPHVPSDCEHTGHVFHLRFNEGQVRDRFISHLREREISAVFHYQPLHLSDVGRKYGGFSGQCPVSEKAGDCLVRLPLYHSLSEADQNRVIEVTKSFHA
jgi:dTDP-4-amino-4,6-dideoxygalactose transaminase